MLTIGRLCTCIDGDLGAWPNYWITVYLGTLMSLASKLLGRYSSYPQNPHSKSQVIICVVKTVAWVVRVTTHF